MILLCSDQVLPELYIIRNVLLHSYLPKNYLKQANSQNFNLASMNLIC